MGPRGPRAYGLRPRLWLLVVLTKFAIVFLLLERVEEKLKNHNRDLSMVSS